MSNLVHNLTNSPNLVERIKGIDRDIDNLESWKQDKLIAWEWITIDENNVISSDWGTPEWWNIEWDIHDQTDLMEIIWDGSEILSQWAYDDLPVEKQEDWTLYLIYWLWGSWVEEVPYWADMSLSFNDSTSVLTAWLLDQSWHVLWTPKSVTIPTWSWPSAESNTKTFYLANDQDLTTAQAAYDWYLAWKNPIIVFNDRTYVITAVGNTSITFATPDLKAWGDAYESSYQDLMRGLMLEFSAWTVTRIYTNAGQWPWSSRNFLAVNVNYPTPYTPQYDWSPATKKYVDDKASQASSWSTAPTSPVSWQLWYDTTNDVLKVYDWTNWIEVWWGSWDSSNTKTFYLPSDLTSASATAIAQEAFDWLSAWKNAILSYGSRNYLLYQHYSWENYIFITPPIITDIPSRRGGYSADKTYSLRLNYSWTTVTSINQAASSFWPYVLETNYNYSAPYTPLYDGSPATKKYVDDSVASSKSSWSTAPTSPTAWQLWYDTTNNVLKVYDWTNWVEVWWGTASWTTPPSNPTTWTIWYDTTNNVLKVYNWTSWEIVWDNVTTTQPQSPSAWTTWYDITNNEFKIYDWTTWQTIWLSLPTVVNDRYLHTNSSTWELEWSSVPQATASWWNISWTLSDQTDLQNALNAIQGNVTVIENQVDTISISWAASDHLEQAAIVWELYTLDTPMFIQETPTYADATWSQNVWNAAENKQIHIQRIWSWVASSKLKLKVKMVWESSINLSVEVRQWVKTDASATEAWWRWGTLIASWTIPYSSITSSWQDIEVTLDNPFWWTRWQLLDVVVKQAWDIVNTTNYYCIWYDESQYWEAYRLVKYNGSTYTRTTDMPYCTSAWFADKLMCKIGSAVETASTATTITWTASIWSCGSVNFTVRDTTGIAGQWIYKIYVTAWWHSTTSWCFVPWTKIYVEWWTKNVEDVTVWDKILSYNLKTWEDEYVDVTYAIKHENIWWEMYRLTTAKWDLLTTWIHPTYVETADWVKDYMSADRVNVWDKIAITWWQFSEVTSIKTEEYIWDWYNLFTDLNHNYYVGEWFLVANE